MKKFKIFLMFIIHHFIRPIWSYGIFGIPYFLYYFCKYIFSKKQRELINKNKKKYFEKKESILNFIIFWNLNYKGNYKYDGFKGLFDHVNSPFEFYQKIFDCDDASLYPFLYFKKHNFNTIMIGLYGSSINSWHYDCVVQEDVNKWVLFNQGNSIYGSSIDECIKILGNNWLIFKDNIYWKCYWH
jgi:hypothetical protein